MVIEMEGGGKFVFVLRREDGGAPERYESFAAAAAAAGIPAERWDPVATAAYGSGAFSADEGQIERGEYVIRACSWKHV